jgi:L-cysteine desulfidase
LKDYNIPGSNVRDIFFAEVVVLNILKEVLKYEVFPALGCTEPIAVALAASAAGKQLLGELTDVDIIVDAGVYKNGFAVTVPNTEGEKGNLIAGILGAMIAEPDLKMEILEKTNKEQIKKAKEMIRKKQARINYDKSKTDLYIDVTIKSENSFARAVIENSHTNVVYIEKDGEILFNSGSSDKKLESGYKDELKKMKIVDFIDIAENIDKEQYEYIKSGIDMNLKVSEAGLLIHKVGYYISTLKEKGLIAEDVFTKSKIISAAASDARMAGLNYPVMASGGSGNQGIVAILVPYIFGKEYKVAEDKIVKSIALSHLVNSYIKCYTGQLSPLCGCAIAAGVGASVAIVYQTYGSDMEKITLAVNNLISDLGGMLCDGAKGGCALKVASSADSAIRSAYMAMNNHGITFSDGFVGKTAEETIFHLSEISKLGMAGVDSTMLDIMVEKSHRI